MGHDIDEESHREPEHSGERCGISRRSVLRAAGLVAGASVVGIPGSAATADWVVSNDFGPAPLGTYTPVASEWDAPDIEGGGEQPHLSVVERDGERLLDASFPAGIDGAGNGYGGGDFKVDLGDDYDELYCAYRVKFGEGFEFRQPGGKLPGLIGTNDGSSAITGGDDPDGENGWSARMMWRDPDDPDDGGLVMFYTYHPDMPGEYGEDMYWDDGEGGQRYFERGQWHEIQHRVVMNTPGENDGVLEGWFDGEKAFERTDLRFRDVAELGIDDFYFSTFFGGGHEEHWAHTREEHIYFDDFVVSTEPISLENAGSYDEAPPGVPDWDPNVVYGEGDRVVYDGALWEAQWHSEGDEPSREAYTVWEYVRGVDDGSGDDSDDPNDGDGSGDGGSGDDGSTGDGGSDDRSGDDGSSDDGSGDGGSDGDGSGDDGSGDDGGSGDGGSGDDDSGDDGSDDGDDGGSGDCDAPAYSDATVYQEGDRVAYDGAVWEAVLSTMANPPSTDNAYWTHVRSC